jgi:hypothetical protein
MTAKFVNMQELKNRCMTFPEPAKTLILSEKDSIPLAEFLVKFGVWERALKIKGGN